MRPLPPVTGKDKPAFLSSVYGYELPGASGAAIGA